MKCLALLVEPSKRDKKRRAPQERVPAIAGLFLKSHATQNGVIAGIGADVI